MLKAGSAAVSRALVDPRTLTCEITARQQEDEKCSRANGNEDLEARLVINQYRRNTNLAKEVLEVLPEFGIDMCKTFMHQRQVYPQSGVFGQTVHDFRGKAGPAIEEMEGRKDEVLELLEREKSKSSTISKKGQAYG